MNSSVCLIWRLRNNIFSENRYEILAERENRMDLKEFFQQNPRAALGFSGGVDSAFLLAMAVKYKAQVQPYFIKTAFQPEFELHDARELTRRLGVELTVIEHDILSSRQVAENPENRCYYCKKTLFGLLKEKALKDGYTMLLDGTNASDDFSDRPGMQAIRELFASSGMRTDKNRDTKAFQRGRAFYLEQAFLCLPGNKNTCGYCAYRTGASKNRKG